MADEDGEYEPEAVEVPADGVRPCDVMCAVELVFVLSNVINRH